MQPVVMLKSKVNSMQSAIKNVACDATVVKEIYDLCQVCNIILNYVIIALFAFHFLAVRVIFICVYITNYLHFFTMFLSF